MQRTVGQRLAEDLQWTQTERETRFARMDQLFPVNHVTHSATPQPLTRGHRLQIDLKGEPLKIFMRRDRLAGVLILQNGRIRLERYALHAGRTTRWTSFSMTKSVTSTLVGAALHDGFLHSLDDQVTTYLPEMRGSAYDGVSLRQLLTMTSGARWVEDYTAPDSDNVRLYSTAKAGDKETVTEYMRSLPRAAMPGTQWHYNTGETDLTGALVRAATGKTLSAYLTQTIWQRYGMETDATWIAEAGLEYGGSGLSATLRDWGRFGDFVRTGGQGTVDATWFAEAVSRQQSTGEAGRGYGYQWWTYADGSFAALGIFGQSLWIDPQRSLVIVTLGAWPQATGPALVHDRAALWLAVQTRIDAESRSGHVL